MMMVESLAVLFPVELSPPPVIVALLTWGDVAVFATCTVTVIGS
jgi:hypothetical protein